MLQIEINVDRPWLTLTVLGGAVAALAAWGNAPASEPVHADTLHADPASWEDVTDDSGAVLDDDASGGSGVDGAQVVHDAEMSMYDVRLKQEVMNKKEEILRNELEMLQGDTDTDPAVLAEAQRKLNDLLLDEQEAEKQLLASYNDLWDAQGYAAQYSQEGSSSGEEVFFEWPFTPKKGISAHFHDAGYQQRFGIAHDAIDIPTPQGTILTAVADGIVVKVSDKGMGFNSLVIKHANGMTSLYGHVSAFLVKEGEAVRAGEPVAESGGTPGTPGAGHLTTGPHLHLEFMKNGVPVDPLEYLPSLPGVE